MVTIGNDTLPGTIKTVESATSTGAGLGSPGIPLIVGAAYLSEGNASANTVKKITRPSQARTQFGSSENSMLTQAVQDALAANANPVYAMAAAETENVNEDLSGASGDTEELNNAPVLEVADDISITVNSTSKTPVMHYEGNVANVDPGTDEVLVDPVKGEIHADESLGNVGDQITYTSYSFDFDAITSAKIEDEPFVRDIVDFVALLVENGSVKPTFRDKMTSMENNGWNVIGVVGAGNPVVSDVNASNDPVTDFSHPFNTSRLQLVSPSRDGDGNTLLGAYVGKKADIGIDTTPIFKRLDNVTGALLENFDRGEKEHLVEENVVPLEESSQGALIYEDMTTVEDGNLNEANWKQASARLITDFVMEVVDEESQPFVGEFNNRGVANSIRGNVSARLKELLASRAIEEYSLVVEEIDSTTLAVDVGIDTADPLKNIEITLTAGAVQNGVSLEG